MRNSDIVSLINEFIHNEDYRLIMRRRMVDGITIERIAEETGRSPRGIQYIIKRCSAQLNKVEQSRS